MSAQDRPVEADFCYRCADRVDRIYHRLRGPGDYCDRDQVDPLTLDDWAWGLVSQAFSGLGDPSVRYMPADVAAALIRAVLFSRHRQGGPLSDAVVEALVREAS